MDEATTRIAQLLDQLRSQPGALDDPTKAAIRAVWRAVDQTRMHLRAIEEGRASQDAPREELVSLWSDASLAISDINPEFANDLRFKAEFWTDPTGWTDQPGLDISIDTVARKARDLLPHATRTVPVTSSPRATPSTRDVFISHASEDKMAVAAPIANELERHGYAVWLDRDTLRLGDSLRQKIDEGLRSCRYGAVILSQNFFQKAWPQRELDGLVALETVDGRKRVLPVWHRVSSEQIANFSPTLADRLGVSTTQGIPVVVSQIIDVLQADAT
jgi:hypothetical protein